MKRFGKLILFSFILVIIGALTYVMVLIIIKDSFVLQYLKLFGEKIRRKMNGLKK